RIADEDDAPGARIVEPPAGWIVHLARGVRVERVQAKVAPLRILLPALGEGDGGAAPVGRDIAPERRHLERSSLLNERDRAVLDSGGMGGKARLGLHPRHSIARELRAEVSARLGAG